MVLPVYFNEESLVPLYSELEKFEHQLADRDMDLELIFVDDGSGDNSFSELLKIKEKRPETKVIKLTRNFGAVAASKTGLRFVTGNCFTMVAADLQDPLDKVLAMLDLWLEGSKYVICQRESRDDPVSNRILSWLYYRLVRSLIVENYPPRGFDLMLLDSMALPYLRDSNKNINTHLFAHWLGFSPRIIKYHRPERPFGVSRWTLSKRLKLAIDSVTGFSVAPIRLVSAFGLVVAFLSFCYGLTILAGALFDNAQVAGFPTLATLISFFGGLILFTLGVLGEYLWRIFENQSSKPEAVIAETLL